jgi:hypothetical protein
VIAVTLALGVWASGDVVGLADGLTDHTIKILDNCLPGDPGWDPTGGCTLKEQEGDVPFAEFGALLVSPLTQPPFGQLIGHPSWRNEPSYSSLDARKNIDVKNDGGRAHSFTEVANYGGGFVAPLNIGLSMAPECNPALVTVLQPGDNERISGLAPGLHKFQCCIHPWMRAAVRINEP